MPDVQTQPRGFLPPLLPSRECGECVACCKILNIEAPELRKPAHTLCGHCTGAGCAIYEARPQVCRDWHCLWRRIEALPEEARPDRLGVMFALDQHTPPRTLFECAYFVGRALEGPEAFEREEVRAAVAMFAAASPLPVFLGWKGNKHLVHPAPEVALAVADPLKASNAAVLEAARVWLTRYAPIARAAGAGHLLPPGF